MGSERRGGGSSDRRHPVSRDRNLVYRGAKARDVRLSAVRYSARGAADAPAAQALLRGAGGDPTGAESQTSGRTRLMAGWLEGGEPFGPRPDQLYPDAVEVQPRVQSRTSVSGSFPTAGICDTPAGRRRPTACRPTVRASGACFRRPVRLAVRAARPIRKVAPAD